MKNKNILLMLESHVDKIILAISILASLFLLWVFVISGPYSEKVRFQGGRERKAGPSEIDRIIKEAVEAAAAELDKPAPAPPVRRKDYLAEYTQVLASSISRISSSVTISVPSVGDVGVREDRTYALPGIPPLREVAVANLRGAAKVPIDEIRPDQSYSASSATEIEDIDLVSVSARFNTQALFSNFERSFRGPSLRTFEKDARLATPVFARLELQRRTKGDSGNWGPWTAVPRTSIDSNRKLLEELPLVLDEASFGVDIWMSQYQSKDIQQDILQPESYQFTISTVDWMAPEFQDEALAVMEKEELQARRRRMEELRDRRTDRPADTRRRTPTRRTTDRGVVGTAPTRTPTRPAGRERTAEDVRKDFEKELLDDRSDLKSLRNDLLVWVHDDTVVPGNTYQYRLRMGVFNPIAGRDWFQENQKEYKNQLVLWSDYSPPTDEVFIPERIYVFPMNVIADKNVQNDIKGVQVEVAKYYLGQWRDFDFDVYPGQIIGYEVEDVDKTDDAARSTDTYRSRKEPEVVDFTSGMTLVDVEKEVVWGSRLRRTVLDYMIYSDPEGKMRQTAIGKINWDSDTRKVYDEIQKSIEQGSEQRGIERIDEKIPDMFDMLPGMMMPGM